MKTFAEVHATLQEAKAQHHTIDLDMIKNKDLNKKAWKLLKKGGKVYYSADEQSVDSWATLKKGVDSVADLYKYTDYLSIIAPGKIY